MDKFTIILLVLVILFVAYSMYKKKTTKNITTSELKELIKESGKYTLIDVRTTGEFRSGHVPKFKNVPLDTLSGRLGEIPKDKPVIVMCQSGSRSMRAYSMLKSNGYDVTNVLGGYSSY